jgi:hypothetical protein
VAVVLSSFSAQQLEIFRCVKTTTFLSEESFGGAPQSLTELFDLLPFASLGYMAKKALRDSDILKQGA